MRQLIRGFRTGTVLIALAVISAACGASHTKIAARIESDASLNPDGNGRPSPVVIRAYSLRSPAAFDNADFFAIYQNEAGTLGQDLVERFEFILEPGQILTEEFVLPEDSNAAYFGFVAAFRNLDSADWRATYKPRLGKRNKITLETRENRLRIKE